MNKNIMTLEEVRSVFNSKSKNLNMNVPMEALKQYLMRTDIYPIIANNLSIQFGVGKTITRELIIQATMNELEKLIGETYLWNVNKPHTNSGITLKIVQNLPFIEDIMNYVRNGTLHTIDLGNIVDNKTGLIEPRVVEPVELTEEQIAEQVKRDKKEKALAKKAKAEEIKKIRAAAEKQKLDRLRNEQREAREEYLATLPTNQQTQDSQGGWEEDWANTAPDVDDYYSDAQPTMVEGSEEHLNFLRGL